MKRFLIADWEWAWRIPVDGWRFPGWRHWFITLSHAAMGTTAVLGVRPLDLSGNVSTYLALGWLFAAAVYGLLYTAPRRFIDVRPRRIDDDWLHMESEVLLLRDDTTCRVALFYIGTLRHGKSRQFDELQQYANDLAERLEVNVVELLAATSAELDCLINDALLEKWEAFSRYWCAEWDQLEPLAPRHLQSDLDHIELRVGLDTLELNRNAVSNQSITVPLRDLYAIRLVCGGTNSGAREVDVAFFGLRHDGVTVQLGIQKIMSSLRSPERSRRLSELMWMAHQLESARIRAQCGASDGTANALHSLTRPSVAESAMVKAHRRNRRGRSHQQQK